MKRIRFLLLAFFVVLCNTMIAQTTKISGVVLSESTNEPIIGASVRIKDSTLGTITDIQGRFSIPNIPASAKEIEVSYIGMNSKKLPIQAQPYKILLTEDSQLLAEVIVQGAYGAQTKASVTGAISTIDSKKLELRPVSSAVSALEGAASGVQVNNAYGEPGAGANIRIRGFGSVNGSNAPLYVLDGVAYQGSIADINPMDIESISVLKDAASAALFGNKAANGVILITTKKGKSDRLSFNVSINQGMYVRGIPEYETQDANNWMETMWTGYRNNLYGTANFPTLVQANIGANQTLISSVIGYNIYNRANDQLFDANGKLVKGAEILPGYKGDLDWYKPIERTGYRQEYNFNGSAAGQKSDYYFSVGYLDEKGYIKSSDFQRLSARTNINLTPTKWLKVGLNLSGSHQRKNLTNGDSDAAFSNPFMFARNMAPIYPVHLHDAVTGDYILNDYGQKQFDSGNSSQRTRPQYGGRHIVWETELNKNMLYKNILNGQLYANIKFLRDFTFTARGTLNVSNQESKTYDNAIIGDGAGLGRASKTFYRNKDYTFQQQLDWTKIFGEKHYVNVLVGHENFKYYYDYTYNFKTNEILPDNWAMNNFSQMNSLNGYLMDYRTESYLSRIRYNYMEKYYGEFSIRRDGSSKFHKDNRWGNFWSIGGSWMISKEDFMEKYLNVVNDLKLRISYGEVGNDASVGFYGFRELYSLAQNNNLGAAYKTQFNSKDIKWETTQSIGVALEGRFWNRLNASVEYFDKRSKDLLFDVSLPLSVGSTSVSSHSASITKNIGTVSNRGFEINADIDIIQGRDWTWNVGTNGTFLKNKVITLPEENRKEGIISGTKRIVEGRSIYDFWLYKFEGVDQMNGKSLYRIDSEKYYIDPANAGPGKKVVPATDGVIINGTEYAYQTTYAAKDWSGSAIPKWFGSVNTSLSWKDLTFSALFTYSIGGKIMDYNYNGMMSVSDKPRSIHKDALNSWRQRPEGMELDSPDRIKKGGLPALNFKDSQYNNATSDRFLQKASYLTIKNITLSYSLPRALVNKIDLMGVDLSVSMENLWTFTSLRGMTPQQSFNGTNYNSFVPARVLSFGLNVKF